MGKRLFITEKPSVAMEFAKALKMDAHKKDGYMEDDKNIITWCVGHLITMSYPDKYDESLKAWKMDTLPFLPDIFKYEVIDPVKKQYETVKRQLRRGDLDAIYYSGDAAREGEYIQRLVRQFAKPSSSVKEYRVWIDSQTDEEILKGIRDAKPLSEYDLISDSAYMRAAEDYLFGINLSRAYSVKYGSLYNNIVGTEKYEAIAVGRVMTCVLGMVVDRERLIQGTKEIPFFGIEGTLDNGLKAEWKTTGGSKYFESPKLFKPGAFQKKTDAETLAADSNAIGALKLEKKSVSNETKYAPLLYNLAELQGECAASLKISPDETLNTVQALYEKKMVTYPRTDARVLTTAISKEIKHNLAGLCKHPKFKAAGEEALCSEKANHIAETRYTNDALVSDHYAIIPTGFGTENYSKLSSLERAIYDLICARFLAIFLPDAIYEKTSCVFSCGDEAFTAGAKSLKTPGFLSLYNKVESGPERTMLGLAEGKEYAAKFSVVEGKTTPPKRYTSGSIILAMENAGQLIEDPELRAQIKNSGIGTSATRGSIITKLVSNRYIDLNTKTQTITPNERGNIIYEIIKNITPSLLRPEMTANWEKGLDMVASGGVSKEEYLKKLYAYVAREVNSIKDSDFGEIKKLLPEEKKRKAGDSYKKPKKEVAPKFKEKHPGTVPNICPHCKSALQELSWATVCTGCTVKIPKTIAGYSLPEKERASLLFAGKTGKIKGFRKKDGSGSFEAKLIADNDWNIKFDFG